jgi:hypothetical protein
MATTAIAPRVDVERRFFTGMVVAMAVVTIIGFTPSYFLRPVLVTPVSLRVPLTPMVHLHAVTGLAWLAFLIWQAQLIRGRQHQRHMQNGLIGLAIAASVVVVGIIVGIDSSAGGRQPPGWTPTSFLIIPFATVLMFGGLVAAALWWRRRPDIHKRLMLIGTTAAIVPALARISTTWLKGILPPGAIGGMILSNIFLAALVAYDLKKQGRVHPATLWGGMILLVSQPARVWVSRTEAWNTLAARLIA